MTTTDMARIAANVQRVLEVEDRSVSWLAAKTGVPRTTLAYQIRTGRFPVVSLLKIADTFSRPIEDFLAGEAVA